MMMRTAILAIPVFAACMTGADELENSNTNNACSDGKCDADVWKYEAGKTPWVTCSNESGRVTCRLDPGIDAVRPERVLLAKGDSTLYYGTSLTRTAPGYTLPASFSSGDLISAAAGSPVGGFGDVRKVLRVPASGSSVTYQMPYEMWKVNVTSVGPAPASIILKYDVQLSDGATYLIAQGGNKVTWYGALSATPGPNNASATKTFYLPVSAGGKAGAYYSAGSINEAPHFYIEKPGCYLIEGSPVAILTFDENCTRTRQLVPVTPPPTNACTCDVSSACDANCSCDTTCTEPSQMCVAGTQYECDDAGEQWTSGQCCVDGPVECVPGSQYECDDAGEHWTGSMCCIDGDPVCVAGSVYECDDGGEHWSGSKCCVDAPAKQCVAGSVYECDDQGESWTGSTCCVAETATCVAGNVYECDDPGEDWTGSQCCVDGPKQCVAGTVYECDDADESWTGSTCCVAPTLTCTASSSSSCTGTGAIFTGSQCCRP